MHEPLSFQDDAKLHEAEEAQQEAQPQQDEKWLPASTSELGSRWH